MLYVIIGQDAPGALAIRLPLKTTLITLDVPGSYPRPAFTPVHPEEFLTMLDEVLDQ